MNTTHDIDRLEAVIAHAREEGLAGTIAMVGTGTDAVDASIYVNELNPVAFLEWAHTIGATTVVRGEFNDYAEGHLIDGTPATVRYRPRRLPDRAPEPTFTLDDYAAGAGETR